MSDRRDAGRSSRRRAAPYGPALDYRTAGGDDVEPEVDARDEELLYPDYTGLTNGGLAGPVTAVGTESKPTGIRVFSARSAPRPQSEHVVEPEAEAGSERPAGDRASPPRPQPERWVVPPQPTPNPNGFRVSPAVRIIAPGTEAAAPTARTPSEGPRARRRAQLPAIPPPRWAPDVLPRPTEAPAVEGPASVAHTASPGAPITARKRPRPPGNEPRDEPRAQPAQDRSADPDHEHPDRLPQAGATSPATFPARRPPTAPPPPRRLPPPPFGRPVRPATQAPAKSPAQPPAKSPAQPRAESPAAVPAAPTGAAPRRIRNEPREPEISLNRRLEEAAPPTTAEPAPQPERSALSGNGERAQVEERASFSRNTSLMAVGTLIARLTGFGKVLALAWVLGSGRLADAFNLANNLPNSVYDLLLGGVLSATLIPVFVDELRKENRREGARALSAVVTTIVGLLAVLTVVFWFVTPAIIDLLLVDAGGANVAAERHTAVQLLHLFVPQLPLLGAIAVSTALLNARRRFVAPAFSPILCNVVTIAAVIATKYVAHQVSLTDFQTDTTAVLVLGLGTTAGYLVQFLAQVPSVFRAGIRLRPVWNPGHPAVRTVLRLSVWTFGAVVTNQVSFYVIQLLASSKSGSVSSFNYAYQFFQLPYAIFAVSIASVIAPDLAQKWSNGMRRAFGARMGSGIRLTLAILVPAGAGYAIVAQPLLRLALRHGSYSVAETHLTSQLVAIFALGLPGFSVYLLLMRAYQSMKNTRSMFWCYFVENALTIAVGVALYPELGVRGLVIGWVGAYSVVALGAFAHLSARAGGLQGPAVFITAIRVAVATVIMAGVLEGLDRVLPTSDQLDLLIARVAVLVVAGSLVYVTVALWLGVAEVRQVLRRGARSAR